MPLWSTKSQEVADILLVCFLPQIDWTRLKNGCLSEATLCRYVYRGVSPQAASWKTRTGRIQKICSLLFVHPSQKRTPKIVSNGRLSTWHGFKRMFTNGDYRLKWYKSAFKNFFFNFLAWYPPFGIFQAQWGFCLRNCVERAFRLPKARWLVRDKLWVQSYRRAVLTTTCFQLPNFCLDVENDNDGEPKRQRRGWWR